MDGGESSVESTEPPNSPEGAAAEMAEQPEEKETVTVDLANHPVHGNMLTMPQAEVARLLGRHIIWFNAHFRARNPDMRWPHRRYMSLKGLVKKTKQLCKKGKIPKDVRKARVKAFRTEMASLIKGPVEISL
jgi:hypothetical protein